MTRLLAALALAVSTLVVFGSPAHACSCAGSSPAGHAQRADAVFTGQVVSVDDPDGDKRVVSSGRLVVLDVEVDRVFKGEVDPQVRIGTAASSASCGLGDLSVGEPLVFFATVESPREPGLLHSTLCHGTGPAQPGLVADLEAALGEPAPPGDPADVGEAGGGSAGYDSRLELTFDGPDEDGDGVLLWPMLVGLFAVATGAAAYVARRTT